VAPLSASAARPTRGRAAALVFGFLEVAASTGLPMRLLEVGASAGLNLRFDRFRYGGGGASWCDATSPVDLTGLWADAPGQVDTSVEVVERRGCDLRPVDPTSEEGRLALRASVWADQHQRLARLRGALELAARVPAVVDAASLERWLPGQLAAPRRTWSCSTPWSTSTCRRGAPRLPRPWRTPERGPRRKRPSPGSVSSPPRSCATMACA
jgi:hypothetical protein